MAARVPDPESDPDQSRPPVDAARQGLTVYLVPMRRRHLRSVLRIEGLVYPRPWSLSLFLSELALRSTRVYTVARAEGVVVGYSGLMLTGPDAHVTTIAVDPAWHRHGIGTRLLANMAHQALERGARHLTLEVRVTNTPAQSLYRKFGFHPAGVRKNYYIETNEDALVMWADDIDTSDYANRLTALEAAVPGATIIEQVAP
ncbi:MAG: [ribosomal protein S18]-alanine N-acetyltransferase [Acidimicrobiaceae bacterium]|nr:[ribosomal protein S18]-alanine N-acetyltransferase [Acidimicrobiaceae bacterium]